MIYIIRLGIILLCLVSAACQVLNAPNVSATLSAENTAYAAEASAIPLSIGGTAVAVAETAITSKTQIAEVNSVNRQLFATLNAVIPPTLRPQISTEGIVGVTAVSPGNVVASDGAVLVELAVTDRKRDSDGCADGTSSQFSVDTPIIYATTRATAIRSGVVVSVEWLYQDQAISSGSYTLPTDQSNFCIWFPLDSTNVTFTAGQWSVKFLLDGQPVEPTVFFNIG